MQQNRDEADKCQSGKGHNFASKFEISISSNLTLMNNPFNFDSSPMDVCGRPGMFAEKICISYRFSEQKRRKEGI